MGERGPAPKPTALRVLEGNPGKRALPKNEPQPKRFFEVPKPPAFLLPLAKKHWKESAEMLSECGLLTEVDLDAFAIMCNSYATWIDAQQQLKKLGLVLEGANGYPMVNPYVSIAEKALNRMLQYQKEFGLTPSARSRVSAAAGDEEEDEFSKMIREAGE